MEESVLLGTKPLEDSIRHFIRDPSGVFSVCHLCECRIVQWHHDSRLLLLLKWFLHVIKRTLHVGSKIWILCLLVFLPLEHKIHISSPPCNNLYVWTHVHWRSKRMMWLILWLRMNIRAPFATLGYFGNIFGNVRCLPGLFLRQSEYHKNPAILLELDQGQVDRYVCNWQVTYIVPKWLIYVHFHFCWLFWFNNFLACVMDPRLSLPGISVSGACHRGLRLVFWSGWDAEKLL